MNQNKRIIDFIVGTRPNFVKAAAIFSALKTTPNLKFNYRLIHTGQHYDFQMSESFFHDLDLPKPDINLGVGSGSQAQQTAEIMVQYEACILKKSPDMTVVFGDVNSTLAAALAAVKMGVHVAHVEAGIRSYDRSMPEEINRILTDAISQTFFTTSHLASEILRSSGYDEEGIFFVGNTMADTLLSTSKNFIFPPSLEGSLNHFKDFVLVTMHRPSNVDYPSKLYQLIEQCKKLSRITNVIFPIHPRTEKVMKNNQLDTTGLIISGPLPYREFGFLVKNAKMIVTDSGGISEEATVWGVPCLTARENTERPETIEIGSNELIGDNYTTIIPYFNRVQSGNWKQSEIPELWDGKSGQRIVRILNQLIG